MIQPFDLWVDISLIFKKVWVLEGKWVNKLCKNTTLCYKKNVASIFSTLKVFICGTTKLGWERNEFLRCEQWWKMMSRSTKVWVLGDSILGYKKRALFSEEELCWHIFRLRMLLCGFTKFWNLLFFNKKDLIVSSRSELLPWQ